MKKYNQTEKTPYGIVTALTNPKTGDSVVIDTSMTKTSRAFDKLVVQAVEMARWEDNLPLSLEVYTFSAFWYPFQPLLPNLPYDTDDVTRLITAFKRGGIEEYLKRADRHFQVKVRRDNDGEMSVSAIYSFACNSTGNSKAQPEIRLPWEQPEQNAEVGSGKEPDSGKLDFDLDRFFATMDFMDELDKHFIQDGLYVLTLDCQMGGLFYIICTDEKSKAEFLAKLKAHIMEHHPDEQVLKYHAFFVEGQHIPEIFDLVGKPPQDMEQGILTREGAKSLRKYALEGYEMRICKVADNRYRRKNVRLPPDKYIPSAEDLN